MKERFSGSFGLKIDGLVFCPLSYGEDIKDMDGENFQVGMKLREADVRIEELEEAKVSMMQVKKKIGLNNSEHIGQKICVYDQH